MRFIPHDPDQLFRCAALECVLRGRVCVARTLEVEREMRGDLAARSSRRKRGISPEFTHCWRCRQGAAVRERLGDECAATVRTGSRPDFEEQARRFRQWLLYEAPADGR